MKLVIDIDEDVYTRLFDNGIQDNEIATDDICEMARALRLGKPLPKGHGRLIDADELLKEKVCFEDFDGDTFNIIHEETVINADTIIEADKAESEE